MRSISKGFLTALTFLSRIPIKYNGEMDVKSVPAFFTAIGYLPAVIYSLKGLFNNEFLQIIPLVIGFYLFDLFHFDGYLDTMDGMLHHGDKERKLSIMSKSDIGAFAFFFGFVYLYIYLRVFLLSPPLHLFYSSVFGRFSMNILMLLLKPAKEKGLGALIYPPAPLSHMVAFLFTIPLAIISLKIYLISLMVTLLCSVTIGIWLHKGIGGFTGDTLGASSMISQLLIMTVLIHVN